jgi:hypothetical protein
MSSTKIALVLALFVTCITTQALADPPRSEHVPIVRTPLSRMELLDALRDGHLKVFGKLPSNNRLAMAWGQVAFENGGGKYSFNHNLGNIAPNRQDQPSYFNKGDKHWYRAFYDFADGAAAYWEVIKRCQPALARFDSGNPKEAAAWLKRCNYFEASLEEYTPGFTSLFYTAINGLIPEEQREQDRRTQELLTTIKRCIDEAPPTPAADPPGSIDDILVGDRD